MPELMNTCTSGTETISAAIAESIVFQDTLNASPMPFISSLCIRPVVTATTMNTTPGIMSGVRLCSMPVPRISSNEIVHEDIRAFSPRGSMRVMTRRTATNTYGSHALNIDISFGARAPAVISLVHEGSQLERGSKSNVSFGMRKPFLASGMTIASPVRPPMMDGNSGPRKFAVSEYGMTNKRPANSANGQTLSPSEKLRFLPKNFVSIADMNNGMNKPIIAWKMDTCPPMLNTNSDMFNPSESRKVFTTGWFSRLVLTPTSIGVPTAPYDTGVDCSINAIMTAASAGKPRAMSSGPITVAGAPHPAAPSRNVPNSHATMIACTRLSG